VPLLKPLDERPTLAPRLPAQQVGVRFDEGPVDTNAIGPGKHPPKQQQQTKQQQSNQIKGWR
jgi:hypothetical protein